MKKLYPVMIKLSGKTVLRKAKGLIEAGLK